MPRQHNKGKVLMLDPWLTPPTSREAVQVSSHGYVLNSIVASSEPMTSPAQSNCSSSSTQQTAPKDAGLTMSGVPGATLECGWRFQVAEAGCHGAPLSSMFADLGFSVGQVPVESSVSVLMTYLTIFHIKILATNTVLKVVLGIRRCCLAFDRSPASLCFGNP